jgi:hypothetical protein
MRMRSLHFFPPIYLILLAAWWPWLPWASYRNGIAPVFISDSPGKTAQWLARSIRESWGVLWLVIRFLSVRADVSSSVIKAFFLVLHSPPLLSACWSSPLLSPTPRRRTVTSKYSSFTKKCFWGVKHGRHIRMAALPQHVRWLRRQYGIPNISQPYRPPRPVTGIALL